MVGLGTFCQIKYCKLSNYCNIRRTFQPYFRCTHNCCFCYARYGMRWNVLYKKASSMVSVNIAQAKADYESLKPYTQIEASSSCDPFDLEFEPKYQATLEFLTSIAPILRDDIYFTFVTKSALLSTPKYLKLLPVNSAIQITIESYGDQLKVTSPNASNYKDRLSAIKKLVDKGYKVALRLDPIIPPFVSLENIANIIQDAIGNGIQHITTSTVKLKDFQIEKLENTLNISLRDKLKKDGKEFFITDKIRKEYFQYIKDICERNKITFACCRESVIEDTGFCDPFHLIPNVKIVPKENQKSEIKQKEIKQKEKPPLFKKITDF